MDIESGVSLGFAVTAGVAVGAGVSLGFTVAAGVGSGV